MKGREFQLTATEFQNLDKFLSSVTSTVGSKYTFGQTDFQHCARLPVLCALGFECLGVDDQDRPVYCFLNTPSDPPVQFVVPTGVVIPAQWTIMQEIAGSTWLCWNGPPAALLTAQKAREMADKAHQTAKDLQDVLEKIYEASERGCYSLIKTHPIPETVQKRLADLGFKIIESGISWE